MKKRRMMSLLLTVCMSIGLFSNTVIAEGSLSMAIDTGSVIKTITEDMYGISTDWSVDNDVIVTDPYMPDLTPNPKLIRAMNEYKLPVVRLGEGAADLFQWKQAVGAYEQRAEQTLWGITGKVAAGPVETVNTIEAIDENTKFTVTVNILSDTPESAADYAEFLTGGTNTAWGAKRAEYGHAEAVPVKLYELGNEVDYGDKNITVDEYIALCKQFIPAIREKDPQAKFALHTDTGIYNQYQWNQNAKNWHTDILNDAELASQIDYIAVHAYYSDYKNEVMDKVMNAVQSDIESITGSDRIKIYLSEYALGIYDTGKKDANGNAVFTNAHNMDGVLETGNILSRMAWHKGVEMSAYHGISSSGWRNIYTDSTTGETVLNGIGNLLKMFKEYGEGDALATDFTGFSNGERSTVSGIAVAPEQDKLNLIFTNQTSADQVVNITYSDGAQYKKIRETKITANSLTADLTDEKKEIAVNKYAYGDGEVITSYTIPAYSACAVALEKQEDHTKLIYSEDFSSGIVPEEYTPVLNDPYGDLSVSVKNGALKLDGYSDTADTYSNSYVYLPQSLSSLKEYTLDMDVFVNEYAGSTNGNGIVFAASSTQGDILKGEADANAVIWKASGVSEYTASSGTVSAVVSNITENFIDFTQGTKIHYTLEVSENAVSFYINRKLVYTRSGGGVNSSGYIGFMFSDADYSVDDIRLTQKGQSIELTENFVYEENFDHIPEGRLPEGWEVMSGMAVAGVSGGALVVTSQEWWSQTAVKIGGLDHVKRDGLVMEADITLISQHEPARKAGVRNKAGLAYMMDGDKISSAGLLTFGINESIPSRSQIDFTESGVKGVNTSSGFNYGDGQNFLANEKVHMRLVFGAGSTPTAYVNGEQISYSKNTATEQNIGTLGLSAQAAAVKFDNIKIAGQKLQKVTSGVKEKDVSFTYEQDFEAVDNGSLPLGWTLTGAEASAQVKDGALEINAGGWYDPSFILFDLEKVKRQGLTMECDITRMSASACDAAYSHAGLVYLYDNTAEFAGNDSDYGNHVRYSALYTDKPTNNSQQGETADFGFKFRKLADETFKRADLFGKDGDALSGGKTVNFKLELNEGTRLPKVYINGVEAPHSSNKAYGAFDVNQGKIGIAVCGAKVRIDNVKVTGVKTAYIPDISTYKAVLLNGQTAFENEAAAIAAVRVYETDYEGQETDITDMADIKAQTGVDGNCVITIVYKDFTQQLNCSIILQKREEGFIYEENFASTADGSLPEGWTLYRNGVAQDKASAKVADGALELSSDGWYDEVYLTFELEEVLRQGLTMECDITRTAATSGNANHNRAGLAYMIKAENGNASGSYNALYTDKPADNSQQGLGGDFGLKINSNDAIYKRSDLFGNKGEGISGGATVNLKIELDGETKLPAAYINGVKAAYNGGDKEYTPSEEKAGKIGLYVCNAKVRIDNIKISGKRLVEPSITGGITVQSAAADGDALYVTGSARADSAAEHTMLVAAVYDKNSGALTAVSEIKDWNSAAFPHYRGVFTIDGADGYSRETHAVKLMAVDKNTLRPVCAFGEL